MVIPVLFHDLFLTDSRQKCSVHDNYRKDTVELSDKGLKLKEAHASSQVCRKECDLIFHIYLFADSLKQIVAVCYLFISSTFYFSLL